MARALPYLRHFPIWELIVIDEEHETTYKSEQVPRYHARETAMMRGKMEGASVVLGSADSVAGSLLWLQEGTHQDAGT